MATQRMVFVGVLTIVLLSFVQLGAGQGECTKNSPCPDSNNCCSKYGYCGTGDPYCGSGCQAGPCTVGLRLTPRPSGDSGLSAVLTKSLYQKLFPQHLSFYTYEALIEAGNSFPHFGTTGDDHTKKREIAAFAAHVWQETSGLQKVTEDTKDPYCDASRKEYPCKGHHFNGRGPLQLSWNYNYGAASKYLHVDILSNPDLVAQNAVVSFKASLWFWNEYGDNVIPHIHDVITGNWKPSSADQNANRKDGFGVTILIINGNLECDKESAQANNRVNYYKKFCSELGVDPGSNLDCRNMKPFYGVLVDTL